MIWEKLYGFLFGWIIFCLLFGFISLAICTIIQMLYELVLPKTYKTNTVYMWCQKYLEQVVEEKFVFITIYPMAFVGKYFLDYVPFILVFLEYTFIFWLFKAPIPSSLTGVFAYILLMSIGVLCVFKTTKFFIALYDSFCRKLPTFFPRPKGSSLKNDMGRICSWLIIGVVFIWSLLDKDSWTYLFIRWIKTGMSEMSTGALFLLILTLIGITYTHVQECLNKQDNSEEEVDDDDEEEETDEWGILAIPKKKRHKRNKSLSNK